MLEKENDTNSLPKYYLGNVQIEDVDVLIQQGKTKNKKNFQICVPLKYLWRFWGTSDMPLINSEVSLTLISSENCDLTNITIEVASAAQRVNRARPAKFCSKCNI